MKNNAPESVFINPHGKFAWLELTNKCNLECIHCYAESGPFAPLEEKMRTEDWKSVIEKLNSIGFSGLQFIGGEPLIHPDLKDLAIFSRKKGIETVEIYTNGTRIDATWINFFKENQIQIAISFYSHSECTHATITKNRSSYARTLRAIKSLIENDIPLRVGIIRMQANYDEVAPTISFLQALGVKNIRVDDNREIGRGDPNRSVEDKCVLDQLCGACGSNKIAVDNRGDVFPCVFSHGHRLANVRHKDWEQSLVDPLDHFLRKMGREIERRQSQDTSICRPFGGSCSPKENCSPNNDCIPIDPPGGPCP